MIQWAEEAVQLMKKDLPANPDYHYSFRQVESNTLSMVRADGAFEIYHGGLRARTPMARPSSTTWITATTSAS